MSTYTALRHQHSSLQFSDDPSQQEADVAKLFEKGQSYPIKTGTETGRDTELFDLVKFYTEKHNHMLAARQGNWVAVDRDIIRKRSQRRGHVFVSDNSQLFGRQRDREFPWIQFTHVKPGVGRIAVAGFHLSTKGRLPGDPNNAANRLYARKIEEWMKEMAAGDNVALGAGDFNMVDSMKKQDWAFGGGFTSMADELGTYFNTGHGPIDGFISYDGDNRVKAKKLVVLEDDKLYMHTDHFVARGTWSIRHTKEN